MAAGDVSEHPGGKLARVLERLAARRSGSQWMARCPAHGDRKPSLSVTECNGKILLKCFAGCPLESILAKVGLTVADLFTDGELGAQRRVVKEFYDYTDEAGTLLYQKLRYEPKGFSQRRPDGNGGWVGKLDGVRRVLYRLPEVVPAPDVLLVEGEKDADSACALGFVATSDGSVTEAWREEFTAALQGKRVTIIADADEAGRKHAGEVAAAMFGKASSVKVLELPDAKDLTEWIERGGKREQLEAMIREAPRWQPSVQIPGGAQLRAVSIEELLAMQIKPREMVLAPFLPSQGLAELYSERGVGKTHVGLGIAYAVSTGGKFLRWTAPKPRGVLYIDGEMPASTLREWLSATVAGAELVDGGIGPAPLRIITPDLQDGPMPDLATAAGQAAVEPFLDGIELLILDNLSALCLTGEENEGDDWVPMQSWFLSLRRRGITVLFLHHAGKSGAQRGTSRREDQLDTVIKLTHPSDYSAEEGLRAEVHFGKTRGFYGDDAKPFEVRLQVGEHGESVWAVRNIEDVALVRAGELFSAGESVREVAEALGISRSAAGRLRVRWKQQAPRPLSEAACPAVPGVGA
jgi:hypothetical protein